MFPLFSRGLEHAEKFTPFKDRAIRMVTDRLDGDRSFTQWMGIKVIAPKIGVATETQCRWYEQ